MINSPESLPIKEKDKTDALRENFCGSFKNPEEAVELFKKIAEQYQSENRLYHNLDHIENLLNFLNQQKQQINNQDAIKLAAWFHDVVYNTEAKDNEEQSAEYAQNHLKQLGISEETLQQVITLIMATKKHEIVENNPDSAIFLDGDLAILGSNNEEYDQYAAKIRQEYAWVPDDQYKTGRKKVLEDFLNRPRIYFTEEANQTLGQQARKNLEREIKTLS